MHLNGRRMIGEKRPASTPNIRCSGTLAHAHRHGAGLRYSFFGAPVFSARSTTQPI